MMLACVYFNLELGVFGGLVTPVCSYILSESIAQLLRFALVTSGSRADRKGGRGDGKRGRGDEGRGDYQERAAADSGDETES